MNKKNLFLILAGVLLSLYSSVSFSELIGKDLTDKTVIATVDNLRIRETSELNSKVTGYMGLGEIASILEVSDITVKVKDKEDYWYKVKTSSAEGWVFGGLITDIYSKSSDKNIILWANDSSWVNEEIKIYYYNRTSKKLNSYKIAVGECSNLVLSPDGKYFAQDCGTDAIRSIGFFIAETGKAIDSASYVEDMEWKGNNRMELENIVFVSLSECCSASVKTVFENGKLTVGKDRRLRSGCCENVYKVNVPVLKIYDTPGGKGNVICSFTKDSYIDIEGMNDDKTGLWVEAAISGRCKKYKGNYLDKGYVLKSELRKEE